MAAKYVLFKGANGQYYFRLKAANGEPILSSEGYLSKAGATDGIASVKKNSGSDANYERRTATNGQFYFVLKAGNNQVIGMSEMYTSSVARDNGIQSVKTNGPNAVTEDLT